MKLRTNRRTNRHSRTRALALLASFSGAWLVPGCAGLTTKAAHSARFEREAVAADHPDASRAGARVLAMGGNAVDAAVATSFALSVVRPYSCGLGGGGFMVVRMADDPRTQGVVDPVSVVFDYRERAPAAVTSDHFFDLPEDASRFSGSAVGIPGTVRGLLAAHDRFGVLPRSAVLAPAIKLAGEGFFPGEHGEQAIDALEPHLGERSGNTFGDAWLRSTYTQRTDGSLVRNPQQAELLRRIAESGASAFYEGDAASAIVLAVREAGGVLTRQDLSRYRVTVTTPVVHDVTLTGDSYTLLTMPSPSSGGVAIAQLFGLLEAYHAQMTSHVGAGPLDPGGRSSHVYAHALTESMKHAFADRARWMADAEFVEVPTDRMLDRSAINSAAERLHPERVLPIEEYGVHRAGRTAAEPLEDGGTSHLSVVDAAGNAVACTETINLSFGSRIAVPELGIVLNNEMDDFLTRVGEANAFGLTQSRRNLPAPGKRPLSSMSPTIVLDGDGRVIAVAGASGGPRIITATAHALLNSLHFGMAAGDAVAAPRWHHQWAPDTLFVEAGMPAAWWDALGSNGHAMQERSELGVVQLIVRDGDGLDAASDPRKGGAPAGR